MNKTKIFVSAFACEPNRGSEPGVGWHWVLEMSRNFELWVLTREENKKSIEHWMEEQNHPYDIHFVYYDMPKMLRFWQKKGRGIRIYYVLWQKLSNKVVRKTMKTNDIPIYHLLTYGNSLWCVSRYGMKQFFIWGPTGGVDTIPKEFCKYYDKRSRLIEFVRRTVVKTLPFNYGFQKRCKNANLIFCKSYNMYYAVPEKYREKAMLFTDVAVEMKDFGEQKKEKTDKIKYIAAGRLDAWRGLDLLIEAFDAAYQKNQNITLEILGRGTDEARLHTLIRKKKLDHCIHMCGEVAMEEYFKKMNDADVIVNSNLKEGAVTVSFDSMALSKPLICVDTGGYTRYFHNDYAIVLERRDREQLIKDLTEAILKMTDKKLGQEFGRKAHAAGEKYTWKHKGDAIYTEIEKAYKGDCGQADEKSSSNRIEL